MSCNCNPGDFCDKRRMFVNSDFINICKDACKVNLLQQAINYTSSSAYHIYNGMPIATDEVFQERISICEKCPNFDPNKRICKLCGCPMDAKAKWADAECPDETPKWESVVLDTKIKSRGCCG